MPDFEISWINALQREKLYIWTCALSEDTGQSAHPCSLTGLRYPPVETADHRLSKKIIKGMILETMKTLTKKSKITWSVKFSGQTCWFRPISPHQGPTYIFKNPRIGLKWSQKGPVETLIRLHGSDLSLRWAHMPDGTFSLIMAYTV